MRAELVYAGGDDVRIPSVWSSPRHDQLKGTTSEQLIELCGRGCYDSLGTGRNSRDYHQHLLEVKHYSVHEHCHFTLTFHKSLDCSIWIGVPDIVFVPAVGFDNFHRLTVNFRHVLEWPNQLDPVWQQRWPNVVETWGKMLRHFAHLRAPNIFPCVDSHLSQGGEFSQIEPPQSEREHFVSLFLEDSRVWSHEMVRHRFNMSQRSGRYCDETDREYALHPLLREYFDECGFISLHPEDGEKIFCDPDPSLSEHEIIDRKRLGQAVSNNIAQSRVLYDALITKHQEWLVQRKGFDKITARKQARSAARYYLGNGLSTEMIFTASIANWRTIFSKRIDPGADAAISQLMDRAREIINSEAVVSQQTYLQ